ncbi:hypothetical protein ACJU26_09670 [Acidithiobacillus sp. M4-SHS-6]|uniref:hypothetical protein n=1 Tax=Acidithiobacillus sp. M4-SHS-6 TaxID=3383024 RepID=UPI0039BE8DE4
MAYLHAIAFLLLIVWVVWVLEIPGLHTLRGLILRKHTASADPPERWAMEWYRATFAPDSGIPGLSRALIWSGWISWLSLFVLSGLVSLYAKGWLPNVPGLVFWVTTLVVVSSALLLILLGTEAWLLHRKGVPGNVGVRRDQWLQAHPVPQGFSGSSVKKLSTWFWLDEKLIGQFNRIYQFLGGIAIALLLFSYDDAITISGFLHVLFLWGLVVLWFPVPFSVWLSRLDWTHRDREVLLAWAGSRST